jgi:hypothetical protein
MGRQFNFYLSPRDANSLYAELRGRFSARLLVDYSPTQELFDVDEPYQENSAGCMDPHSSQGRYYVAPSFGRIKREYLQEPNWWVLDTDSEAVEFSGCKTVGDILIVGRFWYWPNTVENGQFVSKSSEFLSWAEGLYRFTKKHLHYDRKIGAYVGEEAMRFRDKGGHFAAFIRPDGKIVP